MSVNQNTFRRWKVVDLITWSTSYLEEKGFENSRLQVERLLSHSLKLNRVELYLNFDKPLTPDELAEFKALFKRRLEGVPLQYILGETEFMSLPFKVGPGILIPRPETETLVEKCIDYCSEIGTKVNSISILDVGTGSGNIAVSLAKYVDKANIVAIDVSETALNQARENARLNGFEKKILFKHCDIMGSLPKEFLNAFDLVVSNPPYISITDYQLLTREVRDFEPKLALCAGEFGLDFYCKFSEILVTLLKENGTAYFEIGEDLTSDIKDLFTKAGYYDITVIKDLADKDRILKIKK